MRRHEQAIEAYAQHFDTLVPGLRKAPRDSFLLVRGVEGGRGS
jgi:hypothetical protein